MCIRDRSYAGQEDDTDSSEKKEELPNIIVAMNESFSDLNVLGDFTTNEDYMPYLHSLQNGAETVSYTHLAPLQDGITRNTKGVNICQEWDLLEIAFTKKD